MTDLQKCDIAFIMHKDFLGRAIAWFTKIPGLPSFAHSFMLIELAQDRTYISETSYTEIALGWLESYTGSPDNYVEIWRLPALSDAEKAVAVQRALSQNQRLYPYWQFISLAIRGLLKKIGIHIGNFLPWGYDCNEHVHYSLQMTHYPELANTDPRSLDILDFYQLIINIPGAEKVYTKQVGA